ncbi:MAG TPA: hypothetical protein VLJ86_23090, partial [Ramlibacter sp.]|nr:hypothetical protein [Ramlibacter sp.]
PFKLWDLDGELRLEFVNGELASTWFYPANPRDLEGAMTRRNLTVGPNGALRLHAGTELRAGVDFTGAKYWAWEDVHLRQEVERWIKRNA